MNISYRTKKYSIALIVVLLFGVLYFYSTPPETSWTGKDSHLLNLSLGAFGGFFILLVQFLIDGARDKELETLQDQKIIMVLETRDDEKYYSKLITSAKSEIFVYGVTASRFINDFADGDSPRADKKIVQAAISRGVKVQIAVAAQSLLSDEDKSKAASVREKFIKLQNAHGDKFEVREYDHAPTFALTVVDNHCLFGPVFPNRKSKDSATIHALRGGYIADLYVSQFIHEWDSAKVLT